MRVHHLALRTADLTVLEQFYVQVIGLRVLRRTEGSSVWLDADGTIVMLEQRSPDEPAIDPRSMDLTCFAIAPHEHRAVRARLDHANVGIESRTDYSLYFRDPDGRRIGLSSYPEKL